MTDDTIERILIQEPGFYTNIEPAEYFAEPCPAPAFTNSLCRILIDETPADAAFVHPALNPDPEIRKASVAMRMGDVTHQLTLGKGRGYAVGDFPTWASNASKDFKLAAESAGLTPVKRHEFERAEAMAEVLKGMIAQTLANIAIERGIEVPTHGVPYETEVVIAWKESVLVDGEPVEIWCRAMLDVWCPLLFVILDPKITDRLTDKSAPAHMDNMGWATQAALYKRGITALIPATAGRSEFIDLMVKPRGRHTSRAVAIDKGWLALAESDIAIAMERFARCIRDDAWPDYGTGVHYMAQPSWAAKLALERAMDDEEGDHGDGAE